jgi:hypothetical protein
LGGGVTPPPWLHEKRYAHLTGHTPYDVAGGGQLHTSRVVCSQSVIQSFADETTADLFRECSTRSARRISREIWRVAQRKLKALDVPARLDIVSPF